MTEKQLIDKSIKNDPKAQQMLYETFAPKMFGVCLRYVSDIDVAKDILQDSFITVFSRLSSFNHEGSFEGWIRRIVVNTALMHLRKTTLFVDYDNASEQIKNESVDPSALEVLSVADLMKIVDSLPPGFRTVFNLFAIEGYSHKEIGQLLNITESSSRSQYSRARKQLQQIIISEYGESYRQR